MRTTKDELLERLSIQIDEQTAKGAVKYGKPLEACNLSDYDWQSMQIEELIDGSRYQFMENRKLKRLVDILEKENKKLKDLLKGGI